MARRQAVGSSRLRIVFLGTAQFAVPTLKAFAQGPDEIVAVMTRPDRPAGRGRSLRAPPIKSVAQELGLPVFQPERVSAGEGLELLREMDPDVLFVAAFGEVLGEVALARPRIGPINLHASLLPSYRGAAPIQRAILAGERETGVTVQWMAPALDAGELILQRSLEIGREEDFGSLHDRLAALGAEVSVESLALLRTGKAPRTSQSAEDATYAPPIRREELVIQWFRPAGQIARTVRAFSPRPGARTTREGKLLKVLVARESPSRRTGSAVGEEGAPGRIVEFTKEGFWVAAGNGRILALRVQPEGRAAMSAADYLKGYRLSVGEQLGL